nr:hypothetical protein [Tanacetum cinerariifolium]
GSPLQPPSIKIKCTQIESRANRRSIKISLGHNVKIHLVNIMKFTSCNQRVLRSFLENLPEHPSDTKVFTMKMEILLEPTSNKLLKDSNSLIHSYRVVCFDTFRTMATTIEQQVAMDEALVPSTQRLRIRRSNLRLPSDIQSKESTLQLVYDVLPYVHQQSIRFKMNNKKHIMNLESFRDMLHISPRIPGQSFNELPFEEEILEFIRFLGHSAIIKTLTYVNINKIFQPWRSFAAIINKFLTGKSSGYDSFRLSQAQILWGLYHKRNIDYAFLIWEDFVYQIEHKNHKKSNEMYYPRFTKLIIHHFMSKDPSIPRRNKINWHFVRDDSIFSTIKVVSRHQNTQQYSAMLPIELTNDEIRNTKAYKEYYAFTIRKAVPKPKASTRRKRIDSYTSITPPTATPTSKPAVAVTPRLTAAAKGKQTAKNEGTGSKLGVLDVPNDESEEELSWNSSDDEGADDQVKDRDDDEGDEGDESNEGEEDADKDKDEEGESDEEDNNEETREEESFDPIPKTPEGSKDEGDGEEDQSIKIGEEERLNEEEEAYELYRDVNINQGRGLQVNQEVKDSYVTLTPINFDGQQESSSVSSQFVTNMLNPTSDAGMESIFATASSSVAPLPITAPTMTPSTITTITTTSQAPIPPTPILSEVLQNLPTFDSVFHFDDRLKSLEASFSKYR